MATKSERIRDLLKTGMKDSDIAKKVGCSRNLVYVVKSKSKGPKKPGAAKKAGKPTRGRPRGRPRGKSVAASAGTGLEGLVAGVRSLEAERDELKKTLTRIRDLLDRAL